MKKGFISLLILVVLMISVGCDTASLKEPVDLNDQTEYDFIVPSGASTKKIASLLEKENLIQKSYAFTATVKKLKLDGKLQAGHYKIKKSMNTEEIATKIASGAIFIDTFKFTIPEGFEFTMIVERLEKENLINKETFMDLAENHPFKYKFLKGERKYIHRLEGFLYPATYELKKGTDELGILSAMLDTFDSQFKDEYYTKAEELGYSVSEVITLASIIERECVVPEELKKISSVFHNRLAIGQMLQADSTVQYITKERKEKMLNSDIAVDTPYNTYKYTGLTPSPICSPSIGAIEAALYPDDTKLFYFVVTGDNDGRHNFSETYKQHLKYKNEAERKLKK